MEFSSGTKSNQTNPRAIIMKIKETVETHEGQKVGYTQSLAHCYIVGYFPLF